MTITMLLTSWGRQKKTWKRLGVRKKDTLDAIENENQLLALSVLQRTVLCVKKFSAAWYGRCPLIGYSAWEAVDTDTLRQISSTWDGWSILLGSTRLFWCPNGCWVDWVSSRATILVLLFFDDEPFLITWPQSSVLIVGQGKRVGQFDRYCWKLCAIHDRAGLLAAQRNRGKYVPVLANDGRTTPERQYQLSHFFEFSTLHLREQFQCRVCYLLTTIPQEYRPTPERARKTDFEDPMVQRRTIFLFSHWTHSVYYSVSRPGTILHVWDPADWSRYSSNEKKLVQAGFWVIRRP